MARTSASRNHVQRITDGQQHCDRTQHRSRNGERRNKRCPPVLQKDECHHEHDHEGFEQCSRGQLQAGLDEPCRIVDDMILQPRRKSGRQTLKLRLHGSRRLDRICIGRLVDLQHGRFMTGKTCARCIIARAKLKTCDIPQEHFCSVCAGADDDTSKFIRIAKAPLRDQRILKLGAHPHGWRACLTERCLNILTLDRRRNLIDCYAQSIHSLRVEPDAHRIFGCAHNACLADAGHTRDRIDNRSRREIGDLKRVQAIVRRIERYPQHEIGERERTDTPCCATAAGKREIASCARF